MNQRLVFSRLRSHSLLLAIVVSLLAGSGIFLRVSVVGQEIMGGKIIPFAPFVLVGSVVFLCFLICFIIIKHYC